MFALLLPLATVRAQQENKKAKDEKSTLSKQERKWLEVYRFSKQRYDSNPDFRLDVDEAYRRMQREHSEYAFSINAQDAEGKLVKRDKYKVIGDTTLYNNPLAQDYVNRVGQSMVPVGSDKLYAFRLKHDRFPPARFMSPPVCTLRSITRLNSLMRLGMRSRTSKRNTGKTMCWWPRVWAPGHISRFFAVRRSSLCAGGGSLALQVSRGWSKRSRVRGCLFAEHCRLS